MCDGRHVALQKKQDATELIQSTEEIQARLAAKETEVQEAKTTLDAKIVTIGNIVHESVPVSNDEVRSKFYLEIINGILLFVKDMSNCSKVWELVAPL